MERLESRWLLAATLQSLAPAANSPSVAVSTDVTATFTGDVDAATVTDQSFVVHAAQSGRLLTSQGDALSVNQATVTLDPSDDFFPGQWVSVTATDAIDNLPGGRGPGGAPLPQVWQFQTAATGGDGLFTDNGQSLGDGSTRDVDLGDVDGDGDLDALVANVGDGSPNALWLNDGAGMFSDSGQLLGDHNARGVGLGDLDGDGDLDAFIANFDQPDRIWLNDGSGVFTRSGQSLGDHESKGATLGDLDGDGDLDALVNGDFGGGRVWLNDGSAGFTEGATTLEGFTYDADLADVDGDGDLDVFFGRGGLAAVRPNTVWLNDGTGSFSDSGQALGTGFTRGVDLGDVDDDGDMDAFVANNHPFGGQPDRIWLNDGSGNFSDSGQALGDHLSTAVSLGDVDGDADLDAFVGNGGEGDRVFLNDGSGNFTDSAQSLGDHATRRVALGDVDGDGDLDAFVGNVALSFPELGNRVFINGAPPADQTPPQVTGLALRGSGWTLADYAIETGSAAQFDAVPYVGLDQVVIAFSEDVVVSDAHLSVAADGSPLPGGTLAYDATGHVATWTLPAPLETAAVHLTLSDAITDAAGNLLDGDWTDGISSYPSGDGGAGGSFAFCTNVVIADVDQGGFSVGSDDLQIVLSNFTQVVDPGDFSRGDFAGSGQPDGVVGADDLGTILSNFTVTLGAPCGLPTAAAAFEGTAALLIDTFDPEPNRHDVPASSDVSATFAAVIDPATVTDQSFVVHGAQTGRLRTADGDALNVSGMVVSADPALPFHPGERVEVTATSGITALPQSRVPVPHDTPEVWRFRVAPQNSSGEFSDSGQALGASFSTGVAVGDVDGDGDLDAVVANSAAPGDPPPSQVWLNDGDGNLAAGLTLDGSYSRDVALGDADGDGDLDALFANGFTTNRLWLNDGSGNFSQSAQDLGSHGTQAVALGDVDGDGDLDALLANNGGANTLLINDGAGNFGDSGQALGTSSHQDVDLGDLDGDGDLDAVTAALSQPSRVWLNDGTGGFTQSGPGLGQGFSGVELGDLDGDRDLDIFFANQSLASPDVVLLNNGAGGFSSNGQTLGSAFSSDVALGDIDADGDLDALLTRYDQGGLPENRVFVNDGSGQFSDSGQAVGSQDSAAAALGDFDGDQTLDAFVANVDFLGGANRVWFNRSTGVDLSVDKDGGVVFTVPGNAVTYTIEVANQGPADALGVTVTDVFPSALTGVTWTCAATSGSSCANPGGIGDLAESVDVLAGGVVTFTVTATVDMIQAESMPAVTNAVTLTVPADVVETDPQDNQHHDADLLFPRVTGGSDSFTDSGQVLGIPYGTDVELGDVDGDGDLDAVVTHRYYYEYSLMFRNDGSGNFTDSNQELFTSYVEGVALGDVDGDSDLDAFVASYYGSQVWRNDGSGNFANSQYLGPDYATDVALGDVDGDGDLDALVSSNDSELANVLHRNDGAGNFSPSQTLDSNSTESVALGDVDGDGDLDAVIGNFEQADRVWLNDGSGNFSDSGVALGSFPTRAVAFGDADGDGDLDIFESNFAEPNQLWINQSTPGAIAFVNSGQSLGSGNSRDGRFGDVDDDGDLDVVVANDAMNDNRVWLNNGSGVFSDSGQPMAPAGSAVAVGDVDGDGDLDLYFASYTDSDRVWLNDDAAAVPPRVEEVLLSGDNWTHGRHAVPSGVNQFAPIPYPSINQVSIRFSEDVTVANGDLTVVGAAAGSFGTTFSYDAGSSTATWQLNAAVSADEIALTLSDTVTGATGLALDGEWTNGSSSFPSGDGSAGGAFSFCFNVLPADLDESFVVGADDLGTILANFTRSVGIGDFSLGDITGPSGVPDGVIGADELGAVL
ncbi:MAG: hypothetical protein CMJ18_11510, partial [Phycisphaeraceae bacterium]|nr:hypothetical protein [Phycisphaeraceae bacterium]